MERYWKGTYIFTFVYFLFIHISIFFIRHFFIYIYMKWKSLSRVPLFVTPWTAAHRLLCPWNSLGKNTGVGCHFLLQGNFLIQGSNPGLLHYRQILYCLSHQGSPVASFHIYIYGFIHILGGENGISFLAWEMPWMEEPGGLQSKELQKGQI